MIADIKSEGEEAAISALVEYTGLSCSTFAKSHIWELLSEYGYASDNGNTKTWHKTKMARQPELIVKKERHTAELWTKNADLEKECELLRGRLF